MLSQYAILWQTITNLIAKTKYMSTIKKLPKHTVELEITIPWATIKSAYEKTFASVAETIELPGFRKGKAPKKLIEEKIDKSKVYEQVIKDILPDAYDKAVKEHDVKPVISPHIELLEAKEDADWVIKATVAEKPDVKLKNYKVTIEKAKGPAKKLWVPGQDEKKKEDENENPQEKLGVVLKALLDEVEVDVPEMIIHEEVNRMLARLMDETKTLGLTVEQYLQASGKNVESIRGEYHKQAEETLKLEFILEEIAEAEKVQVSQKEIDEAISKIKDPAEKERLKGQSYYLASVLRRQKTLDNLLKPIV